MPTRISKVVKSAVIQQWLEGIARDTIAANDDLSDGGVTNIISGHIEFHKSCNFICRNYKVY